MTLHTLNMDPKYELLKAIRLLGDDETGEISSKILKCVSKEFGERMANVELQEMILSKWISELSLTMTSS